MPYVMIRQKLTPDKAKAFAGGCEFREAMEWETSGPEEARVWVVENSLVVET